MDKERCPRCNAPEPQRHPAMQFEGEVQLCAHPWHASDRYGREALARSGDEGKRLLAAAVDEGGEDRNG
jgi:hypothetical protein